MKTQTLCINCGAEVTAEEYFEGICRVEVHYECEACGFRRHMAYGEFLPEDSDSNYAEEMREKFMTLSQKKALNAYHEILERLDNSIVVFDIDGTLTAYDYGDGIHNMEGWEEAFCDKDNNPYAKAKAVPIFLNIVNEMGRQNCFICSVADDYELEAKSDFVAREYGIHKAHHKFVKSKEEKLKVIKKISKIYPERKVVFIDDTVKTLDLVHNAMPDVITLHVSLFLMCCGIQ